MVPSRFPARSAPIGVRGLFSCCASPGETALAGPANRSAASPTLLATNPGEQWPGLFRCGSWASVALFAGDKRRLQHAMRPRPPISWPTVARRSGWPPPVGFAVLAWLVSPLGAFAAELYHDDALDVRWDNTLSYTAAFRLFPRDEALVVNPNWDDGDRNFDPGAISNRIALLSELEVPAGDSGLRLSGAAWYDPVSNQRNDNASPATFNPFSVPHDQF